MEAVPDLFVRTMVVCDPSSGADGGMVTAADGAIDGPPMGAYHTTSNCLTS